MREKLSEKFTVNLWKIIKKIIARFLTQLHF